MAFIFLKTFFTPIIAIVGGFKHSILIIPISEYVASYIVGIDVFGIFEPIVMKNF